MRMEKPGPQVTPESLMNIFHRVKFSERKGQAAKPLFDSWAEYLQVVVPGDNIDISKCEKMIGFGAAVSNVYNLLTQKESVRQKQAREKTGRDLPAELGFLLKAALNLFDPPAETTNIVVEQRNSTEELDPAPENFVEAVDKDNFAEEEGQGEISDETAEVAEKLEKDKKADKQRIEQAFAAIKLDLQFWAEHSEDVKIAVSDTEPAYNGHMALCRLAMELENIKWATPDGTGLQAESGDHFTPVLKTILQRLSPAIWGFDQASDRNFISAEMQKGRNVQFKKLAAAVKQVFKQNFEKLRKTLRSFIPSYDLAVAKLDDFDLFLKEVDAFITLQSRSGGQLSRKTVIDTWQKASPILSWYDAVDTRINELRALMLGVDSTQMDFLSEVAGFKRHSHSTSEHAMSVAETLRKKLWSKGHPTEQTRQAALRRVLDIALFLKKYCDEPFAEPEEDSRRGPGLANMSQVDHRTKQIARRRYNFELQFHERFANTTRLEVRMAKVDHVDFPVRVITAVYFKEAYGHLIETSPVYRDAWNKFEQHCLKENMEIGIAKSRIYDDAAQFIL